MMINQRAHAVLAGRNEACRKQAAAHLTLNPWEIRRLGMQVARQQQPASDDTMALGMLLKQHSKHVNFNYEQRLHQTEVTSQHSDASTRPKC